MAAEGSRLTSFYVAAPVCSPSRAALMTGCYPKRIDMATGSDFGVLLAGDKKGLNPDEITIAEVLKSVRATRLECSANGISAISRSFSRPGKASTNFLAFPTAMTFILFIPLKNGIFRLCHFWMAKR